ncbi:MAG: CNNM domain-containing protein, partial [Candidatus Hydrothermales bacterium]
MIFLHFILLIITFLTSFLASGTETAFFSLTEERTSRFPIKKERKKMIKKILIFPGIIIFTIVSINTFVNTLASSVFSSLTFQVFNVDKKLIEIVDTVILGSFLFVFCETLPKNFALKSPHKFL